MTTIKITKDKNISSIKKPSALETFINAKDKTWFICNECEIIFCKINNTTWFNLNGDNGRLQNTHSINEFEHDINISIIQNLEIKYSL